MICKKWIGRLLGVTLLLSPVVVQAALYGLYSETVPGASLDVDSYLGVYSGGTASITPTDDTAIFTEGAQSKLTQVNIINPGDFAGWFIQWGVNGTADSVTKNMTTPTNFSSGSLRFWFKGPAPLKNLLIIGIRSGNVPPGAEQSKVSLSSYVTFDNIWHPVVIPLSVLTGGGTLADLTQTKVLLNVAAVYNGGGSSGLQSFWVDNVRWDTQVPGKPTSLQITPPSPVSIAPGGARVFTTQAFDALGVPVDIEPGWGADPRLGTLSFPGQGVALKLTTPVTATPITGIVSSAYFPLGSPPISQSVNVTVDPSLFNTQIKNVSDNTSASQIAWSVTSLPSGWVRADQYIVLPVEGNTSTWGVQIYTENKASDAAPAFNGDPANIDPSGLIETANTQKRLPLAWSVKDSTSSAPAAAEPNNAGDPNSFQWLYAKDRATVDIPAQNVNHFDNGESYIRIFDGALGVHATASAFFPGTFTTLYIYLEANFAGALAPRLYKTSALRVEFFQQ